MTPHTRLPTSAPARPLALALGAALMLSACGQESALTGTVVDIWGDPIQGAMVKLEGLPDRPVTDSNGRFSLPFKPGTHTIKAGLEGYIQEDVEVVVPEDAKLADHPVLRLYPIPEEKGFHVIGADRYVKVEPKPIHALGNNLKSLYGLQEPGSVSVDGSQLRFVYHGDLRQDQLMALDLSLHPLEFVKTAELVSVTTQEVPLNLYVADGEVPLRVERLKSRNDYLLSTDATLERGRVYAITTNGLLTPKDDADFRKIAPALRLAFPVELR